MKTLFGHSLSGNLSKHLSLWHRAMQDRTVLNTARNRGVFAGCMFAFAFLLICVRLFDVMLMRPSAQIRLAQSREGTENLFTRADITDRNGNVLASQLVTASVYANPKEVMDPKAVAMRLSKLIPSAKYKDLLKKLESDKRFVWVARHVAPKLQQRIHKLGQPGVYLRRDEKRVYPYGNLVSHIVGFTGVDGQGLSGLERSYDDRLLVNPTPMQLSLDVGVQHVIRQELASSIKTFNAKGGFAIVLDLESREILGMVSLPDFDPNKVKKIDAKTMFNRATLGVYEHGSLYKVVNTAIALEAGGAKLSSFYDASEPIKIGRHYVKDYRGKRRVLSMAEGFIYSSNIVMAKMALGFGAQVQRAFLKKFGLLSRPGIELPVSLPLVPKAKNWHEPTVATVAYGYGAAFSPIALMDAFASIIKDGKYKSSTLLISDREEVREEQVVSKANSKKLRQLMRLAVTHGTVRKANVAGYEVIAKTGTAHKVSGRGYNKERRSSCIAAFPMKDPKYLVYLSLDEPHGIKETHGFATAGWTAAPGVGNIVSRIAPQLGMAPTVNVSEERQINLSNPAIRYIQTSHVAR